MDAGWAVQAAVHAALVADVDVTAALGGQRVFDHVPRGRAYPYMTFGQCITRDWSTGDSVSHEHLMVLHVWSRAAGREEVLAILAAARTALHDQALALADHRLINLRHESSDVRRDPDGETFQGLLRFRAVTEPMT